MAISLFGFEFKKKQEDEPVSFVAPDNDDGASIVSSGAAYYGIYMDIDGSVKNDIQNIQTYRTVSIYPDIDIAIQDIVNEAIPNEDETEKVKLDLDGLEQPAKIKKIFNDEFKNVLRLLKFNENAPDIFRQWYIDGRKYYHVIPSKNPRQDGIAELRPIEATRIKKVRELIKDKQNGVEVIKEIKEYYLYTDFQNAMNQTNGTITMAPNAVQGIKISPDAIIYAPSGFFDNNTGTMLSYLHPCIRPANQLRMMEDSMVVYRVSRAPERRVFYIDVGNLPKGKAEQHMKDIMNRYRNKLVYDANTGSVRNDKAYLSLLEDFWLPRRDGGAGTKIDVLPGASNIDQIGDVTYFQEKLWQSLNVPSSRLRPETGMSLGNSQTISRDEVKFQKFIEKLRGKFSNIILEAFKTQLILKGIVTLEDWEELRYDIKIVYQTDNYFAELKNIEILNTRLAAAMQADQFVGKYYSVSYIRKNILKMDDDTCDEMDEEIAAEAQEHPEWYPAMIQFQQQSQQQDGASDVATSDQPEMLPPEQGNEQNSRPV